MKYFYQKKNKAFTLIEIMVATSIFIIVMLAVMSGLITSADSAKRSTGLQEAMDNVNFAMDTMSRTLRISTNYTCLTSGQSSTSPQAPQDCPFGGASYGKIIEFVPPANLSQAFGLTAQDPTMAYSLYQRTDGSGTYSLERCSVNGCVDIVSSDVNVEMLHFYVNGSSTTDTTQPSIYIVMKGTVMIKGQPTSFAIQTLASQRSEE